MALLIKAQVCIWGVAVSCATWKYLLWEFTTKWINLPGVLSHDEFLEISCEKKVTQFTKYPILKKIISPQNQEATTTLSMKIFGRKADFSRAT